MPQIRKLPQTPPTAPAEAREQADAYDSVFASTDLELDDGSIIKIPPHPDLGLLDDDRMEAYEELMFEMDTEYEREQDIIIPEQHLESGSIVPETSVRGALKRPFRKLVDGKSQLVKPPHSIKVAQAALGDVEYKRLREGGRGAGDVWKIWSRQGVTIADRQAGDSKSDASTVDLAAVPETDRP